MWNAFCKFKRILITYSFDLILIMLFVPEKHEKRIFLKKIIKKILICSTQYENKLKLQFDLNFFYTLINC